MMGDDFLLPCAAVHVGVYFSGRNVLVAKHFLNASEVGSVLYQVRGE